MPSAAHSLTVSQMPQALVATNLVYVEDGLLGLRGEMGHVMVDGAGRGAPDLVFAVRERADVGAGQIALNRLQRRCARAALGADVLPVRPWAPPRRNFSLVSLRCEVDFVAVAKRRLERATIDVALLGDRLRRALAGQVFSVGQVFVCEVDGTLFQLSVGGVEVFNDDAAMTAAGAVLPGLKEVCLMGMLTGDTKVFVVRPQERTNIVLENIPPGQEDTAARPDLFKAGFNFEKFGIGGLDAEADLVFRRAFTSRVFPPSKLKRLGMKHVRGILLHGPPGCGKTLIARQIGKMLNCVEPKIVNGPDVLSKWVGESEANVRQLFADAEREQAEKGDDSALHLIVFDEFDAICRQRGSCGDSTGVRDGIVNQLLAKIDGVDGLDNVLLIGMTNRKDLIDEALLRPKRFEVHIEVHLPDLRGRRQILGIHTRQQVESGALAGDVDLDAVARAMKNYTGAEIEGVVTAACSCALHRMVDVDDPARPRDGDAEVSMADFRRALCDVRPQFGAARDLAAYMPNGAFDYGVAWRQQLQQLDRYVAPLRARGAAQVVSVLLDGVKGAGKTALAALLAQRTDFPFTKVVSMEDMVGVPEHARVGAIRKAFDDAHKSPYSVVVLDDVERLIEHVAGGQRFSNATLQALMVLMKKVPPQGRRLLVVGTTSDAREMETVGLTQQFDRVHHVPELRRGDAASVLRQMGVRFASAAEEEGAMAAAPARVAVKTLLLAAEIAQAAAQGDAAPPELADERGAMTEAAAARRPLSLHHWALALDSVGMAEGGPARYVHAAWCDGTCAEQCNGDAPPAYAHQPYCNGACGDRCSGDAPKSGAKGRSTSS